MNEICIFMCVCVSVCVLLLSIRRWFDVSATSKRDERIIWCFNDIVRLNISWKTKSNVKMRHYSTLLLFQDNKQQWKHYRKRKCVPTICFGFFSLFFTSYSLEKKIIHFSHSCAQPSKHTLERKAKHIAVPIKQVSQIIVCALRKTLYTIVTVYSPYSIQQQQQQPSAHFIVTLENRNNYVIASVQMVDM